MSMTQNTMKRTLSIAMGALVLVLAFGLFGFAQQAQAANYTAGTIKAQSTATASKKVVKGTINSGKKVTKTFTMPEEGYVTFTVNVPKGLGTTAVRIDYHSIRFVSTDILNGSIGDGKFTSGRFSIKPGAKFKVTLELSQNIPILKQSLPYTITMTNKTPDRYEKELNNSKSTANELTLNKAYSGNIMKKGRDWFVFKAPKDGTYKVMGKMHLSTKGGTSWSTMELFNGSTPSGTKLVSSGNGYTRLGSLVLKKGQKAYVKITPAPLSTSASENYVLKVC